MPDTLLKSPALGRFSALMPWRARESAGENCCIPGEIHIGTLPSGSDGLILRISPSELLFREASQYQLERTGRRVTISFLTSQVTGTVTASRPSGYRIRLAAPLDGDLVAALLDDYGVEAARE